jgi:hypothetical protein
MKRLYWLAIVGLGLICVIYIWWFQHQNKSSHSAISARGASTMVAVSGGARFVDNSNNADKVSESRTNSRVDLKTRLATAGFRSGTGFQCGFENPSKEWEFVQTLVPEDEDELLTLFHAQSALRDRVQYMRMMVQCGGDKSALALINTIKSQKGIFQTPDIDENYDALHVCIYELGAISTRSEIARQFLGEATDEEYWKLNRQHTVTDYIEPHENRYLASEAIKALARGGHPEAMELINTMRQWEPHRAKLWAGALVDAVFEYEMAGRGYSVKLSFIDSMMEFQAWKKTDTGREWKQWSAEMRMLAD